MHKRKNREHSGFRFFLNIVFAVYTYSATFFIIKFLAVSYTPLYAFVLRMDMAIPTIAPIINTFNIAFVFKLIKILSTLTGRVKRILLKFFGLPLL